MTQSPGRRVLDRTKRSTSETNFASARSAASLAFTQFDVIMKSMKNKTWISCAVAGFAGSVTLTAKTEYLCNTPKLPEDKRACEFAKLDQPNELVHYVQHTGNRYRLSVPDYVSEKDVQRWELARLNDKTQSVAAKDSEKSALASR